MSYTNPTPGQIRSALGVKDPLFTNNQLQAARLTFIDQFGTKPTLDDAQALYDLYKNPPVILKIEKTLDLRVANKLLNLNRSAISRNIPFGVSFSKLKRVMQTKRCFFTGVPFNEENILSIERLDNDDGYFDHNIVAVEKKFNTRKGDLTLKEIAIMYKKLKKRKLL